jgi:hypothetical protein
LERRIKNNRNYSLAADLSSVDEKSDGGKWEGGDGFDEGMSHVISRHPNTQIPIDSVLRQKCKGTRKSPWSIGQHQHTNAGQI